MVRGRKIHRDTGQARPRFKPFECMPILRTVWVSAARIDALVYGVEHTSDQEGFPFDGRACLCNNRLDVVKSQSCPGRGQVKKEFDMRQDYNLS